MVDLNSWQTQIYRHVVQTRRRTLKFETSFSPFLLLNRIFLAEMVRTFSIAHCVHTCQYAPLTIMYVYVHTKVASAWIAVSVPKRHVVVQYCTVCRAGEGEIRVSLQEQTAWHRKTRQLKLTVYIVFKQSSGQGSDNKRRWLFFFSCRNLPPSFSFIPPSLKELTKSTYRVIYESGTSFVREQKSERTETTWKSSRYRETRDHKNLSSFFSFFVCVSVLLSLLFSLLLDEAVKRFRGRKANVVRMAKIVSSVSSFQRSLSAPKAPLSLLFYIQSTANHGAFQYELIEIVFPIKRLQPHAAHRLQIESEIEWKWENRKNEAVVAKSSKRD